jgi:hypothetical protein
VNATDTANHFMVVANGGTLAILNPPGRPITPREALNLAAWLIALARTVDPELSGKEFYQTVDAIQNT